MAYDPILAGLGGGYSPGLQPLGSTTASWGQPLVGGAGGGGDPGLFSQLLAQQSAYNQAMLGASTSRYNANLGLQGTKYSADAQKASSMYGANLGLQGTKYSSDAQRQASELASRLGLQSTQYSSDAQKAASQYSADQSLAGLRYSTDAQGQRLDKQLAYQQNRFNSVFPAFQAAIAGYGQGGGAYGGGGYGGPPVSTGAVYSPEMIQGQVNSQVAQADARNAGQETRAIQDLSGRGLSGSGPLAAALHARYAAAGGQQAADIRRDVPWQAAQGNADTLLRQQSLAEGQYAARQGEAIQRAQVAQQGRSSLLAALAGVLGGG
jgi:hypothetical protein